MVRREKKERHQHARDRDGTTNLHHALGFVVVAGQQLIMQESVKNVAYQDLKLSLLAPVALVFRLHSERENGMFGRSEEAASLTHGGPP